MEEAGSPRPFIEPCHIYGDLYKYFLEQPSHSTLSAGASLTTTSSSSMSAAKKPPLRSMLVTGFGIRNLESLQRALLDDEQRRQMLLARYDKGEDYECSSLGSTDSGKVPTFKMQSKSTSFTMDSDMISVKSPSLQYLMGLAEATEEYEPGEPPEEQPESIEGEVESVADERMTQAMRMARRYFRQHKIFEFFQFLIAHMLSELPDNPIQFLIDLLDRCLLYRSGFGNPPLLFEKPHLEQLFYLMDRMRTGFIEVEQYESGMKTLGICSFDQNPPLSTEGAVSKEFFIEEAYDCLTDLFVDMIRRRGGQVTPPSLVTPPPTEVKLVPSLATSGGQ
ncbi:unnamed protein product [Tenebrio molitor]|nr:unnamed protein product [Tenebrio molitor]